MHCKTKLCLRKNTLKILQIFRRVKTTTVILGKMKYFKLFSNPIFLTASSFTLPIFFLLFSVTNLKNQTIDFSKAEVLGINQIREQYQKEFASLNESSVQSEQIFSLFFNQIDAIADSSNLILDPELETIHLVLLFASEIPKQIFFVAKQKRDSIDSFNRESRLRLTKANKYILSGVYNKDPSIKASLEILNANHNPEFLNLRPHQQIKYLLTFGLAALELTNLIIESRIQREIRIRNTTLLASVLLWLTGILLAVVVSNRNYKLERKNALAEESIMRNSKLAEMGLVLAKVAHEINNPLSVIAGKIGVLKRLLDSNSLDIDSVKKSTIVIDRASHKISRIVLGLKNNSRNSDSDDLTVTNLKSIFDDIEVFYHPKIESLGITLTLPADSDLSSTLIQCRPSEIGQVFLNLISNSADAIESQEEKWIKVSLTSTQNKIILSFIDSGKGIPKAIAEKLMVPFFTTKGLGKGTGLGLSICKKIIETHGGQLALAEGKSNTTFEITLPIETSTEIAA